MGLGWQHMDDCGRELTEPIDTAMLAFDGDNHPFRETDLHSRMLGWNSSSVDWEPESWLLPLSSSWRNTSIPRNNAGGSADADDGV